MANKIPEVFKIAFKPSVLSKITPNNLTPSQKMLMARCRIWNEIIGGNLRTGNRVARTPLKGDAMIKYFDYGINEFIFPFPIQENDQQANDEIDEYREVRNSRKGKSIVVLPKREAKNVPKHEKKRFLHIEKKRNEREAAQNAKGSSSKK
ncbi:hypothetical protein SteCoe_11503 [Stentor coeruleus]|uniref:Uncharacterized protein n=1 Tax=Stentor coeruleus TaxID=5963 RepID=A0A1R2CCY6_9CILI|nr:hypothetical protein SteCoe_11503 [Stentor coeruleus]